MTVNTQSLTFEIKLIWKFQIDKFSFPQTKHHQLKLLSAIKYSIHGDALPMN